MSRLPHSLPLFGWLLLAGSLAACSGGGEQGGTEAAEPRAADPDLPDLASLTATARQAAQARDAVLGDHTIVTETVKVRDPSEDGPYRTVVVRGAAGSDVRTEFAVPGKVVAHCLYREIVIDGLMSVWFLSGHHLQYGQKKLAEGQIQFGRWFDHPALQSAEVKVTEAVTVDGRGALIVEVPPSKDARAGGESAGALDVGVLEAAVAHVAAVEGLSRKPTHIFGVEAPVATASRLWIDRETGQLLRAEGALAERGVSKGQSSSIRWGEFKDVAPGVSLPHLLEFSVAGEPFSTTRVTSVQPGHGTVSTDVEAVHTEMEVLAQVQNEEQYRDLIARTDIKQAEPDPVRDEVFHPVELTRQLGIAPGDVVADIGAGTGYFTTYLAEAAGPSGRVYATDINPALVDYLRQRLSEPALNPHGNVECVVNDFDDLGLPDASVDLAFLAGVGLGRFSTSSDTNRAMIDSIFAAVKPGGRVVVIENRNQGSRVASVSLGLAMVDLDVEDPLWVPLGWPGRPAQVGHLDDIIVASFEAAGFQFSSSSDLIVGQAFLFLDKPR